MDHGMDGWGYWIDEELGRRFMLAGHYGNVSTGIRHTGAWCMPGRDSVADINNGCLHTTCLYH